MKQQNPMLRLWELGEAQHGSLIQAILSAVVGVLCGMAPYFAAAQIILGLLSGNQEFSFYLTWCAVALAGFLLRASLYSLALSISHKATFSILKSIREKILEKLPRMPLGTILDTSSGQMKQVIVDQVESMERPLAHLLPEMTANVLGPVCILVYLFVLDWRMALLSLVSIPVGMAFMMAVMAGYGKQYEGSVRTTQAMNSAIVEYIGGIEVIKAFNQGKQSYARFSDSVKANASYFYHWMKSCQMPISLSKAISPTTMITILPAGWLLYAGGSLPVDTFITTIVLSLGIAGPLLAAMDFVDSLAKVGTIVGELTGIATTILDEVESAGAMVLVTILGGLINSAVMLLCVLFWDWRIGLLALAGMALYLLLLSRMEKQSAKIAPKRQRDEARLVEAVLEQLQGMSVIKSFNLTGKGDKRVRQALENSRSNNLAVEKLFTPYIWAQEMALHLFSVVILVAAVWLYLSGGLTLANALMSVIISFLIFSQIQSAGSGVSALRLVGSSIDHANQVDGIPEMDQDGAALHPDSHDIVFDHVDFSYGSRPILKDVSLTIPDRTTTAIVGPSGSGKTTLCNLIARFWDVEGGRVAIGGRDVREYTLESLMDQVSMVFQRVYLFHDTIENNIKFGCPNATHEQVMDAAKKACCHDFISALPEGYDTVIGESGATLSGGEKQRISIARCLLKDAPIVIFDEATANVDPENEDQLQKAMEALTREKTVLMIAHRLKTVRSADQILVLDQGRIVQRGTHGELIGQEGIYRNFVTQRAEAGKWSL